MPRLRHANPSGIADVGMAQLRWGFDHKGQRFNRPNVSARRRYGASDCHPADMPTVEAAYWACRDHLLASVSDPWMIWAYRRFELNVEPIVIESAWPAVPPKPDNLEG